MSSLPTNAPPALPVIDDDARRILNIELLLLVDLVESDGGEDGQEVYTWTAAAAELAFVMRRITDWQIANQERTKWGKT